MEVDPRKFEQLVITVNNLAKSQEIHHREQELHFEEQDKKLDALASQHTKLFEEMSFVKRGIYGEKGNETEGLKQGFVKLKDRVRVNEEFRRKIIWIVIGFSVGVNSIILLVNKFFI